MTKFTEGRWPAEGLIYEEEMSYSRQAVTIASGAGVITPGTVLGKITASGKYTKSPNAQVTGIEGAETAVAIALYGCDATSADQNITVIVRNAVWNINTLSYDASVSDATKKAAKVAQLKSIGIVAR